MQKKKIITALALLSVVAVGAATSIVLANDSLDTRFEAEAVQYVAKFNPETKCLERKGGTSIRCNFENGEFATIDPIQKISKIDIDCEYSTVTEIREVYYLDNGTDYTKFTPLKAFNPKDGPITYAEGYEPSGFMMTHLAKINSLVVTYKCETVSEGHGPVNRCPVETDGIYLVGEGSFVSRKELVWSPSDGKIINADTTQAFKAGDIFKIVTVNNGNNVTWNNLDILHSSAYQKGFISTTEGDGNAYVMKDFTASFKIENNSFTVNTTDEFDTNGLTNVYVKPNSNWLQGNVRFVTRLYYEFGEGENLKTLTLWVNAVNMGNNVYRSSFANVANLKNIIFVRCNGEATSNGWTESKWNQTNDLTLLDDGNDLYTVADNTWDKGGGTWSKYAAPAPEAK